MLDLARRIRKKLWLVSYYSARREQSPWSRALGWALLASVLLPVPLVLLGETLHEKEATLEQRSGGLLGVGGGVFEAMVRDPKNPERRMAWGEGEPYGEWTLSIVELRQGWPFASMRDDSHVQLDLNLFAEAAIRMDERLPAGSPVRTALEEALAAPEHQHVLAAWHERTSSGASRDWLGTITIGAIWWITLSLLSFILVRFVRIGVVARRLLTGDRRTTRRATGRCVTCDYDLRGLEFSERCPECGTLLH